MTWVSIQASASVVVVLPARVVGVFSIRTVEVVASAVVVVSVNASDVASVESVKEVSTKTVDVASDATVDKVALWITETAVDVAGLQGLASAPNRLAATTARTRIDRQPISKDNE